MIIYNVTTKTDWSIHEDWLQWMQEVHIPEMLQMGIFYDCRLLRLLEVDEEEGPTYTVQYIARSMADYHLYIARYAADQRQKTISKWGNRFIAFRSVMQTVN